MLRPVRGGAGSHIAVSIKSSGHAKCVVGISEAIPTMHPLIDIQSDGEPFVGNLLFVMAATVVQSIICRIAPV